MLMLSDLRLQDVPISCVALNQGDCMGIEAKVRRSHLGSGCAVGGKP